MPVCVSVVAVSSRPPPPSAPPPGHSQCPAGATGAVSVAGHLQPATYGTRESEGVTELGQGEGGLIEWDDEGVT